MPGMEPSLQQGPSGPRCLKVKQARQGNEGMLASVPLFAEPGFTGRQLLEGLPPCHAQQGNATCTRERIRAPSVLQGGLGVVIHSSAPPLLGVPTPPGNSCPRRSPGGGCLWVPHRSPNINCWQRMEEEEVEFNEAISQRENNASSEKKEELAWHGPKDANCVSSMTAVTTARESTGKSQAGTAFIPRLAQVTKPSEQSFPIPGIWFLQITRRCQPVPALLL
ncbi:hypothetical protein NDU88_004240 [Pleurodeles waltl]|uniref:Uncharacterized protein n=1 Tax=Pleurodeles waltl TaxID=8319 RepID=A0AAV7V2F5_PLEWA|nr:hypothetical protein NDU88_004240 [Pleurodeles waltl]